MAENLTRRLQVATDAALEAGKVTLQYFQTDLDVERKADSSPVTVADREAEARLFDLLRDAYPADAFLGEERGEVSGSSGFRWIVDPIDGTKSFIQGVPLYGVMVALEDPAGDAVVGVVHIPPLGELVSAAKGEGCLWNGNRARVSTTPCLAEACITFTCLDDFAESQRTAALLRVVTEARVARGWGDCYGHILVATGRADAMVDPILSDWDCAALLPILEEAGGTFSDWDGRRTHTGKSGISTNGVLRDEVLRKLHSATDTA